MALSKPTKDIGITTCPICLEEFKTPKCLPCLHNFCETCLNSYIITAFKSESDSKVGKSQFNCPVCRRPVTPSEQTEEHQEWAKQFPLNHTIVSLMDQNKLKAKVKLCDPCKSIDDDVIAETWCLNCNEAMCQLCSSLHKRQKFSRDHDLINIAEMQTIPLITSLQACRNHKGKSVEAFCKDHNLPCCATCVAIHHRKCDHVMTLEEAADGILESKDLSDLLERLKGTSAINQKIVSEKRENVKKLEDQKCDIQKELQETRQRIIDSFDKLYSTFMQKFTEKHNQKVKELTYSINDIENRDKVIQNCADLMETCKTRSSETQVFLEMTTILEREKEETEALKCMLAEHKKAEYAFRIDDEITKLARGFKNCAEIEIVEESNSSIENYPRMVGDANLKECVPELASSFSIKEKCGVDSYVYGISCLPDNKLLIPLFEGKKIAVFNKSCDLLQQNDLKDMLDVTVLDSSTAVSTQSGSSTIAYINIPTLTVNKTVSVGVYCCGITSSDNKVYVGCSGKLLILDKDGKKEKEIKTNGTIYGVTIINQREKKIVYTNYNNHSCHFVRSSDLKEVQIFTHPELRYPRGVTSDREGNVYITGYLSGNVFQLSSEGVQIRILLTGLDEPIRIQFDDKSDKFFVSCSNPATVNIYNMIKP